MKGNVLFRVLLPRGTPYILLPGSSGIDYGKSQSLKLALESSFFEESELVLNRRSLFRVLSIENMQMSRLQIAATKNIKMYTIQYVGQADLPEMPSAESVVNKIGTLTLSLAKPLVCHH